MMRFVNVAMTHLGLGVRWLALCIGEIYHFFSISRALYVSIGGYDSGKRMFTYSLSLLTRVWQNHPREGNNIMFQSNTQP